MPSDELNQLIARVEELNVGKTKPDSESGLGNNNTAACLVGGAAVSSGSIYGS